ncbi:L-seryl-tRNA(Sec) selenium transferase [Spirochaetota bacterium]
MGKSDNLKHIPSVTEILKFPEIASLIDKNPRSMVIDSIHTVLDGLRKELKTMKNISKDKKSLISETHLVRKIREGLVKDTTMNLKRVVNATGIILHTGLGRAVLAKKAMEAISALKGYCNLEIDIESGERGSRNSHVEKLICKLTGAERAAVVNNNAAAILLVLNTFAEDKEVVISRGQLIEIGGSFRLPEVMMQSRAVLREVGTTNITKLADYERAINENTAFLMHVHCSNYQIRGFSESVPVKDLVALGKKNKIPVIDDIGSGAFLDYSKYGITHEPTVQESIAAGVDIATFSADKLLGGPQAGIIAGKEKYIEKIKKNPLTRALRVGKLTLVTLEATLRLLFDEEKLSETHPIISMLTESMGSLQKRADDLSERIKKTASNLTVMTEESISQVGGGSLPVEEIPTKVISVTSKKAPPLELAKKLRLAEVPVFTRVKNNKVLLDIRTVQKDEEDEIVKAFKSI